MYALAAIASVASLTLGCDPVGDSEAAPGVSASAAPASSAETAASAAASAGVAATEPP